MAIDDVEYPMKRLYSVTDVFGHGHEPQSENKHSQDEAELARFGKKQQLRVSLATLLTVSRYCLSYPLIDAQRNFGLVSIVGLTCTLMITWEGSLT